MNRCFLPTTALVGSDFRGAYIKGWSDVIKALVTDTKR